MTKTIISNGLDDFLSYLREMEQLNRISKANEQEANDSTQDILHSLELEDHDYHEYARLSKKLRDVRQTRRMAQDLIVQTTPLCEWVEMNRLVIRTLEQLLSTVRKMERKSENRVYTPRTKILEEN